MVATESNKHKHKHMEEIIQFKLQPGTLQALGGEVRRAHSRANLRRGFGDAKKAQQLLDMPRRPVDSLDQALVDAFVKVADEHFTDEVAQEFADEVLDCLVRLDFITPLKLCNDLALRLLPLTIKHLEHDHNPQQ